MTAPRGKLSPCDLLPTPQSARAAPALPNHGITEGVSLIVGGRLVQQADQWLLADAFTSLKIEGPLPPGCRAGDLVELKGLWRNNLLHCESGEVCRTAMFAPEEFWRLANTGMAARLALRSSILQQVRAFFCARGFLEVETPARTAERCLEENIEPVVSGSSLLITSPELHMKRLLVGGIPRIFQLARCFRGSEKGPLHHPEFLMLEWYRAFAEQQDVMHDTEHLLHGLCQHVHADNYLPLPDGRSIDLTPPFARLTVREAFRRFAGVEDAVQLASENENEYFQILIDSVEPALAKYSQPVFLWEYPAAQAALARLNPSDPTVAERFELYVGGVELCNGYGELNDAEQQRQRMQAQLRRPTTAASFPPDSPKPQLPERFLAAIDQGMPPAGGNALGLDRLIALLAGQSNIDSSMAFAESPA